MIINCAGINLFYGHNLHLLCIIYSFDDILSYSEIGGINYNNRIYLNIVTTIPDVLVSHFLYCVWK